MKADVHVSTQPAAAFTASTYELDRPEHLMQDSRRADDERALRRELDARGFTDGQSGHARYIVSMSYDTRPASILLRSGETGETGGIGATATSTAGTQSGWCAATRYRHSLTLRFFDRDSGMEAYSVTALAWDCHADTVSAWPYLVESALGKLPYADASDWQVTFGRSQNSGDMPRISSTKRVERVDAQ
ncbi:hypothetical protein LMG29739_01758 [Paraburkholderia solisilvae]|uniref:DUF4136 domain-containing protein n=3 Tax=Paraburkholderia solisilvae TaxID=624376 RepID=A0A6J5DGZ6_9BURK|nr:hypothetical protein LMG29739_01758 [Paraburkholderia solisilvae]